MKIIAANSTVARARRGSVVMVLLIFLTLMLMLCAATWRVVYLTQQEVRLVEKHQIDRLAATTNTPPASTKSLSAP
jgi:hypothetical protein